MVATKDNQGAIVKTMTLEEFRQAGGREFARGPRNQQSKILWGMSIGEILVLRHITPCHISARGGCYIASSASYAGRRLNRFYSTRHLPDGNVAVACFAKFGNEVHA